MQRYLSIIIFMFLLQVSWAGENLLKGKVAEFSPRPNYGLTMDNKDNLDLTDGKIINDNVWFYKDAVGWVGGTYCSISFDLGDNVAVERARIRLSAGRSSVHWPDKIFILASEDGKRYAVLDEIIGRIGDSLPAYDDLGSQVWAESVLIRRKFRHIRFLVIPEPNNGFFFSDEIEVLKGEEKDSSSIADLPNFARNPEDFIKFLQLKEILEKDLSELTRNATKLSSSCTFDALRNELLANDGAMIAHTKEDSDFPLNQAQRRIVEENQKLLAKAGYNGLIVRPIDRLMPFNALTLPPDETSHPKLHLYPGERRYQAISVTNADATAADSVFSVSSSIPVTAYHAVSMSHTEGFFNANRLEKLADENGEYRLHILPGENSQIYFEFEIPGDFRAGETDISVTFDKQQKIDYVIEVGSTFKMPERFSTNFGSWDYLYDLNGKHGSCIRKENLPRALELIQKNQMDNLWVDEMAMPVVTGEMFKGSKLVQKLDFTKFDTWYRRMGQYGTIFGIFFGLHIKEQANFGVEPLEDSGLYEKRMTAYVREVGKHLQKELKVSPEKFYWHCLDESYSDEHARKLALFAKAIRQAKMGFKMYSNPLMSLELADRPFEYLDILVRPCTYEHGNILTHIAADTKRTGEGQVFGYYSCENRSRQRDPYTYYGLPFRAGFLFRNFWGASYWNFATAPQSLSEFDFRSSVFSMLYFKCNEIYTSKQFEYIYEAREDYEYLLHLRKLNARLKGKASPLAKEGLALEEKICAELLEEFRGGMKASFWNVHKDRSVADRQREDMWKFFERVKAAIQE